MSIHITHHTYNIALTKKTIWKHFLLKKFSSAAPTTVNRKTAIVVKMTLHVGIQEKWAYSHVYNPHFLAIGLKLVGLLPRVLESKKSGTGPVYFGRWATVGINNFFRFCHMQVFLLKTRTKCPRTQWTMAAAVTPRPPVPHPRLWGVESLANRLWNNAT